MWEKEQEAENDFVQSFTVGVRPLCTEVDCELWLPLARGYYCLNWSLPPHILKEIHRKWGDAPWSAITLGKSGEAGWSFY